MVYQNSFANEKYGLFDGNILRVSWVNIKHTVDVSNLGLLVNMQPSRFLCIDFMFGAVNMALFASCFTTT